MQMFVFLQGRTGAPGLPGKQGLPGWPGPEGSKVSVLASSLCTDTFLYTVVSWHRMPL